MTEPIKATGFGVSGLLAHRNVLPEVVELEIDMLIASRPQEGSEQGLTLILVTLPALAFYEFLFILRTLIAYCEGSPMMTEDCNCHACSVSRFSQFLYVQ